MQPLNGPIGDYNAAKWASWADWRYSKSHLPSAFHDDPKSVRHLVQSVAKSGVFQTEYLNDRYREEIEQLLLAIGLAIRDIETAQFCLRDPEESGNSSNLPEYVVHSTVPFMEIANIIAPFCKKLRHHLKAAKQSNAIGNCRPNPENAHQDAPTPSMAPRGQEGGGPALAPAIENTSAETEQLAGNSQTTAIIVPAASAEAAAACSAERRPAAELSQSTAKFRSTAEASSLESSLPTIQTPCAPSNASSRSSISLTRTKDTGAVVDNQSMDRPAASPAPSAIPPAKRNKRIETPATMQAEGPVTKSNTEKRVGEDNTAMKSTTQKRRRIRDPPDTAPPLDVPKVVITSEGEPTNAGPRRSGRQRFPSRRALGEETDVQPSAKAARRKR